MRNIYLKFNKITNFEQDEIREALYQAAAGILLLNWQELSKLFLRYLFKTSRLLQYNELHVFMV